MKKIGFLHRLRLKFLAVLFCVSIAGCVSVSETHLTKSEANLSQMAKLQSDMRDVDNGRVLTVAHRGCWSAAPENSVAAIENCIAIGVDVVEIDVQFTKDRQLIVFHDRDVSRMTGAEGKIYELTLDELKNLRLYERDGSERLIMKKKVKTLHVIPSLREIFEATRGNILINLEIKSNAVFGFEETFQAAVTLARDMGVENEILWKIPSTARRYDVDIVPGFKGSASSDVAADTIVNQLDIEGLEFVAPIVWHSKRGFTTQIEDLVDNGISTFEIVTNDLSYWPRDKQGVIIGADEYRYLAIAVLPRWSGGLADELALSNPDASWGALIDIGADMIMTDFPEQLLEYLNRRGYSSNSID